MGENATPILRTDSLEKSFGALKATDAVSLDVQTQEIHAVIGPNGAGKSTLIKQICGDLRQDAGTVQFGGRPIDTLTAVKRARLGLGRTFQVSSLAGEFTVLQNTMLAVQGRNASTFRFFRAAHKDRALVEPAMEQIARFGLEDRAAVPVAALSHGERRQLEMAIAMATSPNVLLLDEPMAGIGPGGSKVLTGVLDALRDDVPILLIEHDMEAVFALADRISVLVNGKIIATGSVSDIRNNLEVREAYLGTETA